MRADSNWFGVLISDLLMRQEIKIFKIIKESLDRINKFEGAYIKKWGGRPRENAPPLFKTL